MPNALETPWVILEVNDIPLSFYNDMGQTKSQNDFMEQFFFYFNHLLSLLNPGGKAFNPSCECIYHD